MEKEVISISKFKVQCAEQFRRVEEEKLLLEITKHGKVIAQVGPAKGRPKSLSDWAGSGAGKVDASVLGEFDRPTWEAEEWEEFPDAGGDAL